MIETSCAKCKHYGAIPLCGYWWCQIYKDTTDKHCQYFEEVVSAITTTSTEGVSINNDN